MGRQEVRVNYELRELMLVGVVRPQDIEADNSISHERIAEMRVFFDGTRAPRLATGTTRTTSTTTWGFGWWCPSLFAGGR